MSKIKLSNTMKFLSGKFNAITGGHVELSLQIDTEVVPSGGELSANAKVRWPNKPGQIEYLQISLKGQVQRDDKWEDYVQSAEVAHDVSLLENHEFIVPIVIKIPSDAVLTEDGGNWSLYARAFIDKQFDPREEVGFHVVG